ncbi:cysteine desulfurase family protein [Chelatococcus reniformis]|uniref:Cysteine desulfurase n=1 Tax=Chelatococcus reniformis TaxID=1494448 RepID=A0A916X9E8_9HYPH|nr:cysteine desulfurase family protein [Chelatococcus reniformis]GGC56805.1 cysteine desulfurase [Chelatococcus reniformis]
MADERTYLDYNATSVVRPVVITAIAQALARGGNPSSVHGEGRAARASVEAAREQVAELAGARPQDVVFTSGGTEAANTLLSPGTLVATAPGPAFDRLFVLSTEHACVREGHGFGPTGARLIPVDAHGVADLAWLDTALTDEGPALVALQVVNNETGVVQPIRAAAELVHARGGLVVADAVQAAGKLPLAMADLGIDALFLSAHKLGGPQGVGAIVLAGDRVRLAQALLRGGGQERGHRAGTHNGPGIAGFGAAAAAAAADLAAEQPRLAALRGQLEDVVRRLAPDAVIFGGQAERVANTSAFAVRGLTAETLLMHFDRAGIALSSGSACSSGKIKRSHVLDAMGIDKELAGGALRASLGWRSSMADVVRFGQVFEKALETLHRRAGARRAA